ncbi:MAG: hypothetical protein LBC60_03670, partial [Spirochaetaceae bacterium]|nr:hypothetical protein [Spirochaetaceae bacterium]
GLIQSNRACSKNNSQVSPSFFGYGGGVFIPGNNINNEFIMRGGAIRDNNSASGKGNGVAMDRIAAPPVQFSMEGPVAINGDIHLQSCSTDDCVVNITGPLSVQSPLLITMDAPSGLSKRVLTGAFNAAQFTASPPQSLNAAGYIYTP